MSLFHGRDVSLNTYQYVFYSYSDKSPNVLQATYYDNSQNLIYSTDISFGSKTVGDMMLFLENSQTNPYALGKDNNTPYFRNIDIPFSGLYKKVLTTSHHQLLMSHVNSNYKETYGNAMNIYEVKANGSTNYIIDDISQPDVLGSFAGIYVFDQSDSSNSGHILKFRNKSTQAAYEENVTYAGTPGTLNSFTIIEMDYSTPILEYYCEYHSVAMFGEFKILPGYSVKVVTNVVGDSVYALSFPYSSVYYNQPDLSFGAGDYYIFDVSDPTMANYNLVFGTIADDATTINNSIVSETNGVIILDIPSGYSGSPLVLFDLSNANMGYVSKPESDSLNNTDLVFHIDASVYNYSHNSQINMTDVSINDISPLGHTLNSVNGDATNGLIYFSDDGSRKSLYFPNPGNSGTSETLIYNVAGGTFPDDVFTTFMVNNTQSIYPVSFSRTNGGEPFHSNGEYLSVRNYNNYNGLGSWVIFDVSTNISSSINLQTIVLTPNLLEYDMLGINGETFNDSLSGDFVGSDYDDDNCHNYYIGSIRNNDQPFQGHIYEFLAYKNAYMSDSTIASIQNYLSKKWFTQSLVDNVTSYIVTVSNEVFYIDDVEKPEIAFESSNTYVFDQSDVTNTGQQIVFGYTFDSSNVFVSTDGVQVFGTPGQPGAYTSFTVPSNPSGTIHYYSDGSANMGYLLVIEASYVFSVKHNVLDEPVWALYNDTEAVWYNQPDLSFSAPYVYEFDVSDPSNNGYVLSFGTTVDVSDATIESTYVIRTNTPGTTDAKVLLDLRDYSGDSLVYFEDSSAGMGYVGQSIIPSSMNIEYLVVGGGGQGCYGYAGGGGAGGIVDSSASIISTGYSVNIEVGAGGSGQNSVNTKPGINGDNSVFGSSTAFGGGGGSLGNPTNATHAAQNGGSGGGGGPQRSDQTLTYIVGGQGTPGQGNNGGDGNVTTNNSIYDPEYRSGGGGGGAGSAGTTPLESDAVAGAGGAAKQWAVDLQYYSAGGGGANRIESPATPANHQGGSGGGYTDANGNFVMLGGHGAPTTAGGSSDDGTSGVANTGSGGGAGWEYNGTEATGADGVVKIWVPVTYTYSLSHVSNVTNNIGGSSSVLTYNGTDGTLVSFIGAGTATWSPGWVGTNMVSVTVSNEVFYLDGSANPQIDFTANNLYLFDQSDPTNEGQQIVFGYTFGDSANILTSSDGVTVMGTPGQPGAYTTLDLSSGFVGPLYYYSDGSANMGYPPPDFTYSFTVKNNIIGEPGWASYDTSSSVWYNQPDLYFSAPYIYEFDVSDPSNNGYILSFGTIVDVSDAAIESTYVTRTNVPGTTDAKVLLNLRDYSGVSLVYFEDSSAGMGYIEWVGTNIISVTVSNEVFYLDGSANPQIDFSANESYLFDQSDPTNAGQQIVFGYAPDNTTNILTSADGVTVMGTPGQPGAYTQLDLSSGFTGILYYYSYGSANMGYAPSTFGMITNSGGYAVQIDNVSTNLIAGVDFTIEFFVNISSSSDGVIFGANASQWYEDMLIYYYASSGNMLVRYYWNGGAGLNMSYTGPILSLNQWHHFAVVRNGNTASLYIDGVKKDHNSNDSSKHTMTNSTQALDSTLYLFKFWDSNYTGIIGSMASIRISNKAVYIGNFTAPSPELSTTQSSGTNIQSLVSSDVVLLVKADPQGNNNVINDSQYSVTITEDAGITTTLGQEI